MCHKPKVVIVQSFACGNLQAATTNPQPGESSRFSTTATGIEADPIPYSSSTASSNQPRMFSVSQESFSAITVVSNEDAPLAVNNHHHWSELTATAVTRITV
ncbi:hypothetical protein EB796_008384 [Bugula neritina]|uniref:Uncharacterized protein n=1 Tax=Bugula neritina TaxID=10212 RepID=A0A7J7K3V2_BUGNE|nr:hypothetical protein EB796_008384 [Bugula neritina]